MSRHLRAVAVAVAVVAIAVGVYRHEHHGPVINTGGGLPIGVLVANRPIVKGTTGDAVQAGVGFYKVAFIPTSQIETGAIVDPSRLTGKFAAKNIPAGQQLTVADFAPVSHVIPITPGGLRRAVVIKPSNQIGGQITAGSPLDVWVAATGQASTRFRELDRNMLVLAVSTSHGTVTLSAMRNQIGKLVYAAANHRLVVRPHQTLTALTR